MKEGIPIKRRREEEQDWKPSGKVNKMTNAALRGPGGGKSGKKIEIAERQTKQNEEVR